MTAAGTSDRRSPTGSGGCDPRRLDCLSRSAMTVNTLRSDDPLVIRLGSWPPGRQLGPCPTDGDFDRTATGVAVVGRQGAGARAEMGSVVGDGLAADSDGHTLYVFAEAPVCLHESREIPGERDGAVVPTGGRSGHHGPLADRAGNDSWRNHGGPRWPACPYGTERQHPRPAP